MSNNKKNEIFQIFKYQLIKTKELFNANKINYNKNFFSQSIKIKNFSNNN